MANPRQRRKSRNNRVAIHGPKLLQEAWDKSKTVRQNYEALGLVASLNPIASGGQSDLPASLRPAQPRAHGVPKGYGRIIRDEEGNVVDVELGDEDMEDVVEDAPLEDIPDPAQDAHLAEWVALGSNSRKRTQDASAATSSHVVDALEQMSELRRSRAPRFTSSGELAVLRRLVGKYEEDVEAMARDRKLNVEQRTAGELNRAIRKAGGFAELEKGS
ncbi:Nucleolar protein 16 [Grifola frondosa]|uniref:Nucleolar protein 16 n=1 Tax=Grifola frondosa TaxID=5627 RepID=A0A1C7MH39_GRIFR|nr:Nucleolar protein 16 [Grifola frondosa]